MSATSPIATPAASIAPDAITADAVIDAAPAHDTPVVVADTATATVVAADEPQVAPRTPEQAPSTPPQVESTCPTAPEAAKDAVEERGADSPAPALKKLRSETPARAGSHAATPPAVAAPNAPSADDVAQAPAEQPTHAAPEGSAPQETQEAATGDAVPAPPAAARTPARSPAARREATPRSAGKKSASRTATPPHAAMLLGTPSRRTPAAKALTPAGSPVAVSVA